MGGGLISVRDQCNSLSCPPPPGILSPGTLYPGVKCPTLVYLVPGDTLPRGKVPPPLKFISYLFFFYNFYSATYFIALKTIFCVKSPMNGQNKSC